MVIFLHLPLGKQMHSNTSIELSKTVNLPNISKQCVPLSVSSYKMWNLRRSKHLFPYKEEVLLLYRKYFLKKKRHFLNEKGLFNRVLTNVKIVTAEKVLIFRRDLRSQSAKTA